MHAAPRHPAVQLAVFLHLGKHAVYKFGASDQRWQHTRANNLGLEAVSTPWALLHNPDARLEHGALWALQRRLVEAAE